MTYGNGELPNGGWIPMKTRPMTEEETKHYFEAKGLYKHENGEYVTENTLRIEIMFVEKPIIKQLVDSIKLILNQESVAVQREVVESELW